MPSYIIIIIIITITSRYSGIKNNDVQPHLVSVSSVKCMTLVETRLNGSGSIELQTYHHLRLHIINL